MTWREQLEAAQSSIEAAYAERKRVCVQANAAGVSQRAIGEALGLSAAGVNRIIAGAVSSKPRASLEDPALTKGGPTHG